MTRADLVSYLMEEGFSYRESRALMSTIIEEMKNALARGEDIHLPFGVIHPVKNKRPVRVWALKKITVRNKKRFRFLFRQKWPWI